ncbi:MAG: hypothetical protein ACLQQ4_18925 [Bacteroidia bacterium]
MKIKKTLLLASIFVSLWSISNAQFADFNNYPVTVTPRESPDSTRGHFWGYIFGSYYTKLHSNDSSAAPSPPTQYSNISRGTNAFSIERVYLGYDYFFNKQFSLHAVMAYEQTSDFANAGAMTTLAGGTNYRSLYLKYCNMEWNDFLIKGIRLSVGSIVTPSFAITEEPFWGYRSLERTIMDMRSITPSNDLGASIGGKIWRNKDDAGIEKACVGFNFMVGNSTSAVPDGPGNTGYSGAYSFNSIWKRYYGDIYIKMLNDKLLLDLYGDGHTFSWTPMPDGQHDLHQYEITGRAFLGYKIKNFNISVEYFEQLDKNMVAVTSGPGLPAQGDTSDCTQTGFSLMSAAVLMRDKKTGDPKLTAVLRYDAYNPFSQYNPNYVYQSGGIIVEAEGRQVELVTPATEKLFILALDYQPIKQLHFMPNIWYDGVNSRASNLTSAEKSDYDLVARITFYYQFFKN